MPPTGCVGPERLVRALQVSFFFSIVFFNSNYTHSLRKSPTCHILHPYGTHSVRRAQTSRLGPTGEFFFYYCFFKIRTTPTACVCHQHAIYSTHTAPTGCVGPQRVVRAPPGGFFFFPRSSNSNSNRSSGGGGDPCSSSSRSRYVFFFFFSQFISFPERTYDY